MWQLRAGEAKKHNDGATKPKHVLVAEASDPRTQPRTLDGSELVHHEAASLAQSIQWRGLYGQANQWRVGGIGRECADGYRIRPVEPIVLDHHHRARFDCVAGPARSRPDFASLHPSSRLSASMYA